MGSTAEPDVGRELHALAARLYPIGRSLTGDGVRETLAVLRERIPIELHEVPTGTAAFDWTVPREWNVREAWVEDADGRRVIDFRLAQPPCGRLQRPGPDEAHP